MNGQAPELAERAGAQGPGDSARIAVVIPCYRVSQHIEAVIGTIGPEVGWILCVDDACPEGSGSFIAEHLKDPRIAVLTNERNLGVGGAVMRGYRHALQLGAEIVVKIDGDGQMDPRLLPDFVAPILRGEADYTKGNRFFNPRELGEMPSMRLIGNAVLSFMNKLSSGYWDIFDPTNGYTAIHAQALRELPLDRIDPGYFFESDMLFRLNTCRAVVQDVPMAPRYGGEESSLSLTREVLRFAGGHARNFVKRIVYSYFLRDFSLASVLIVLGVLLTGFGIAFGAFHWLISATGDEPATAGTVMLAGLPIIVGVQMLLTVLGYDVQSVPRLPLQRRFRRR